MFLANLGREIRRTLYRGRATHSQSLARIFITFGTVYNEVLCGKLVPHFPAVGGGGYHPCGGGAEG